MDRDQDQQAVGASAASIEMDAQNLISSLISLSEDEHRALGSLDLEACESEIEKLMESTKKPGKEMLISNVLGQLALLYQRKSQLETELRVKAEKLRAEAEEMRVEAEERARRAEEDRMVTSDFLEERQRGVAPCPQDEGSDEGSDEESDERSEEEKIRTEGSLKREESEPIPALDTLDKWGTRGDPPLAATEQRASMREQGRFGSVVRSSTEQRASMREQGRFGCVVRSSTEQNSFRPQRMQDLSGMRGPSYRATSRSDQTRSTSCYDTPLPQRQLYSQPWDTGERYRPEPRPWPKGYGATGSPVYHERSHLPPRRSEQSFPPYRDRSWLELSDEDSDGPAPVPEQGLRMRQLESLAHDIERFDPSNTESTIEDYLREVERCLLDLPHPSAREKLKLIWKTTSRSVHVFIESLQPSVRDRYSSLCQALREEYSVHTDPGSAMFSALGIQQKRNESPRDYYRRLRAAYFQGRSAPGLEEDHSLKYLFLHNLHDSIRYDVTMYCRTKTLTMQEIRKYAQIAWETRVRTSKGTDSEHRVLQVQAESGRKLELEGQEVPPSKARLKKGSHNRDPGPQERRAFQDWRSSQNREDSGFQTRYRSEMSRYDRQPDQRKLKKEYEGRDQDEKLEQSAMKEMEANLRRLLTEMVRQINNPSQDPVGHENPPGKPDPKPPSA